MAAPRKTVDVSQSGYSRSASLLAHNRVAASQHLNLPCIPVQLIRCLQAERTPLQLWMVHNASQSFKSDRTLTNFFVAVFVASERIFAVIYMDRLQPF